MSDSILPLEFESFKNDAETTFSLPKEKLELALDELDKRGTKYSTSLVSEKLGVDSTTAFTIRSILITIIPLVKHDKVKIKEELESLSIETEKVEAFIMKVLTLKEQTITACHNMFRIDSYLIRQPHIGTLRGETLYFGLGDKPTQPLPLLPIMDITVTIHSGNEDDNNFQEFKVRFDASKLERFITNIQDLLESLKIETKNLKDIWGDKVIDTSGDQYV